MSTDTIDALLDRARTMGAEHGKAAASWYFDGNTSLDTYAAVLKGIEDGDPAVLDTFPSSPLSGEWAGDPTPATVLDDLGVPEEIGELDSDTLRDSILDAYEDGFYSASAEAIERVARYHAEPDEDALALDTDARYRIGDLAVAWYIVRLAGGRMVDCSMVGDDSVQRFDADELVKIGDDDYCPGCGQIGCRAYH